MQRGAGGGNTRSDRSDKASVIHPAASAGADNVELER